MKVTRTVAELVRELKDSLTRILEQDFPSSEIPIQLTKEVGYFLMLYMLFRNPLEQSIADVPEDLKEKIHSLLVFLDEVAYFMFSNLYADVAALPIVAAVTGRIFLREGGTIDKETATHFVSTAISYLVLQEGSETFKAVPFTSLKDGEYQHYVWEHFVQSTLD